MYIEKPLDRIAVESVPSLLRLGVALLLLEPWNKRLTLLFCASRD